MTIAEAQIHSAERQKPAPQVQITVSVSEGLYELINAEIGHCACSMQGFLRHAIALEVQRRRNQRHAGVASGAAVAAEKPLEVK